MKMFGFAAMALGALVAMALPAQAQVTIDIAKVTCEQWLAYKVADPEHIAIWLGGYYSAKRNNAVIEVQAFKEDIGRLKEFCIRNPATPVMQAMETQIVRKK